jgi:hypothetical protein
MPVRIARSLVAALLLALGAAGLSACAHAPDGGSVQQAVDDAVAG